MRWYLRGGTKGKDGDLEAKEMGELRGEMPSSVSVMSCTMADLTYSGGKTYCVYARYLSLTVRYVQYVQVMAIRVK